EAYLNAAQAQGAVQDDAVAEFESFIDVLKAQPKFAAILASAMLPGEEKLSLLEKAIASDASPIFWNFLTIVAKRNRLDILEAICFESRRRLDEIRGRIPVTITTATELDGPILENLSEKLRGVLGGEPIILSQVDPETIGGLVVRVGDTIYDASLLTQLKNVRQQMIDRSANEIQRRRDSFRNPEGN
ncbi:MAG TPA: ATP synthase F1 subunit delta, partial [Planctomycetaceae bacterium]|nr:ATP synthase F1 subunit delta [Planctomycetaceae bacterium]